MVLTSFFRRIAVATCAGLVLSLAGACSKDQAASPTEPVAADANQPANGDSAAVPEYKIQGEPAAESAEPAEAAAPVKKTKHGKAVKSKQVKAKKKAVIK